MKFPFALCLSLALAMWCCPPAVAQDAAKPISTMAVALDAQTLTGANMRILLWGVQPATPVGTLENNAARAHIDDLIAEQTVRCMPMSQAQGGGIKAQCLNFKEQDIALMLVAGGDVAVNRADVMGSELASAYMNAEKKARAARLGIWGAVSGGTAAAENTDMAAGLLPAGIPLWAVAAALLIVPMLGFLLMASIMHSGFRQLITLQKYQLAGTQKRERQLKEREKYVIASALEGEINTNRAKLDAFLVIYEELLKSLRDPAKKPKYQRAGDIIHEKPALSRTVYDAHIDKLELLGPQITSDLSALYGMIDAAPDYRTLEPEVPIEKAREIVDRIVRSATKMVEPMDKAAAALSIVVRDKRGAVTSD